MTLQATRWSAIEADQPDVSLIEDDVYCVLGPQSTYGFVEKVGNVYVALIGPDRHHATEAGQSLSWDEAVEIVVRASRPR
jgi:hypothetical protein